MSHNVTIHGYISDQPEVRKVSEERDVLNFTVASTRKWNGKSGEEQEKTEFFECAVYRARGKFTKLMAKGRFITGTEVRINRAYMDTSVNEKDGKTYRNVQFVVDGRGDINSPALEIISTKAERALIRQALEQGTLQQQQAA
ncbi:single-stranded DNA-binding protein [Vibrio owensii]|uniref:single-stranded DNA-binding protein n=1 Tax=Vibrio harveyi group TaxID=717610 RepID=UPI003CC5C8D5